MGKCPLVCECVCSCGRASVPVCVRARVRACVYTCVCVCMIVCVRACVHPYVRMNRCVYIHTHHKCGTHVYIRTRTPVPKYLKMCTTFRHAHTHTWGKLTSPNIHRCVYIHTHHK